MDNFECPICLDISENAMECNTCAGIFCEKCVVEIKKCPMCRGLTGFRPSPLARKLINNLPCQCQDCSKSMSRCEFKSHICPMKQENCGLCGFKGNREILIRHVGERHIDDIINVFSSKRKVEKEVKEEEKEEGLWENKTDTLTQTSNKLITRTGLNLITKAIVKLYISAKDANFVVIGFSLYRLLLCKGYLGGEHGKGTWGLAGNGSIGEEGIWKKGVGFKSGDYVDLIFDNGRLSYRVNGVKAKYEYKLTVGTSVYIGSTLLNPGDLVKIVEIRLF